MVAADIISLVLATAIDRAKHSWENGTVAEAILEWETPQRSVWNTPFDNGQVPILDIANTHALNYIQPWIQTTGNTFLDGEGSSGDPASVGVFATLIGKTDSAFWDATGRQVDHLLHAVPRWDPNDKENSAISHREDKPVLWSDFIYMVPPMLAYWAVATSDVDLARKSADQVARYAEVLAPEGGLWRHIEGDDPARDPGRWSTGNAWAAAGAARVLATLKKSNFDADTQEQQGKLVSIIKGILDGARGVPTDTQSGHEGLLPNYLSTDDANCPGECFGEISGTALLAATAFRVAKLVPDAFDSSYSDWAKEKSSVLDGYVDKTSGVVAPAVNPEGWHNPAPFTTGSPEGQAFVVLLAAAERDFNGGS